MAYSLDPDQTAPIGAVCSGFELFASILGFVSNARQLFAADDLSRRHFQMHFFLGALRFNPFIRICHECEGRIEKFIPRVTVWHYEACRVMPNGDPEGLIFSSLPSHEYLILLLAHHCFYLFIYLF